MRLTKWIIGLTVALLLVGLGSWWLVSAQAQSKTVPSIPNAATVFDPILSQVKARQVPVRLPTYIPSGGQFPAKPGTVKPPVYASFNEFQPTGYQVFLGYSKTCEGGNACRLGTVEGDSKPAKSITQSYQDKDYLFKGKRSQEALSQVVLSNGVQGVFLPWRCATNCTDAQVVWDEGNYRYSVGIKVGDKASLVRMANSAIDRGGK